MRRRISSKPIILPEIKKTYWKRRPSEIRGYQRVFYCNMENGDYIRVDYSFKDKRVRIYLEDSEEGGNPYYAVIDKGRITAERNATSGRPVPLQEKLEKRSEILSTLPNKEVLRLINKHYGIGETPEEVAARKKKRQEELARTKKRYFKPEEVPSFVKKETALPTKRYVRIRDIVDIAVGGTIVGVVYYVSMDFVKMGIASAVFGIIMAFVDIFVRGKETLLLKTLLFLLTGIMLYIYGYFVL
ncbi:MAG TPA: hypothetical protein PLH80_03285 [Spirochaetota bacterium]|nr:hypothetical protein [Spirochaetota bacterium]HOF13575.1 hypothetical protein [Spirochaetota bacterium]HOM86757.1 hypothetical protein [Spirochaetota bacterium]HOR92408.1 hypothetical protein [Spirochaetota bacterium]HOT18539.1 hypothetical protein [Spirochaetota bacterium]